MLYRTLEQTRFSLGLNFPICKNGGNSPTPLKRAALKYCIESVKVSTK